MIWFEVRFDMENSNALISAAYISQSEGQPYRVFCEYVKYCVTRHPSEQMLIGELRGALENEFGMYFPRNVLNRCLSILIRENFLSTERHHIYRNGNFDCTTFDKKRDKFRETKDYVVRQLIDHVSTFKKTWDVAYAEKALGDFLRSTESAFELFFRGNEWHPAEVPSQHSPISSQDKESSEAKEGVFPDKWYVGNFVQHIIASDNPCKKYLQDIASGLMICIGSYHYSESETSQTEINISETSFFFDTKLLLRLLGCAWSEAVESAKELVKFIQENGGKIYYFPHTFMEILGALERAEKCLQDQTTSHDKEMSYYLLHGNLTPAMLRAKQQNVKEELKLYNIYQRNMNDWSEEERIKFGLDSEDLCKYILSQEPTWGTNTVENDVASIREVQMLRKGNFQAYYGTADRLPIFVTSNTRLFFLLLGYRRDREEEKRIQYWKSNRLPLITDIRLTCRLWNPTLSNSKDIPLLQLTANAVAAQRPNERYYNQLRQTVKQLTEDVPAYSKFSLSDYCDDEFTEQIVAQIEGEIDKLDVGVLATTMVEHAQMNSADEREKRNAVEIEKESILEEFEAQTQSIINCCVERNKDKLGLWNIPIWCGHHWALVVAAIFALLSSIVGVMSQQWYPMLVIAVPTILGIVENVFNQPIIKNWILDKILPRAEIAYKNKIRKELSVVERKYEDTIIPKCISESKYFIRD